MYQYMSAPFHKRTKKVGVPIMVPISPLLDWIHILMPLYSPLPSISPTQLKLGITWDLYHQKWTHTPHEHKKIKKIESIMDLEFQGFPFLSSIRKCHWFKCHYSIVAGLASGVYVTITSSMPLISFVLEKMIHRQNCQTKKSIKMI